MCCAALILQGVVTSPPPPPPLPFTNTDWNNLFLDKSVHPMLRAAIGTVLGVIFINITKRFLHQYEHLDAMEEIGMAKSSIQKMILVIFVMTLHSVTEGVGIGVSFGGSTGMKLGHFISMSLAVHNVPEGLAVGLVCTQRHVSKLKTGTCTWIVHFPGNLKSKPTV